MSKLGTLCLLVTNEGTLGDGSEVARFPKHWDAAHGANPGWYAVNADTEIGNAWAWEGPFPTRDEAIKAALTD